MWDMRKGSQGAGVLHFGGGGPFHHALLGSLDLRGLLAQAQAQHLHGPWDSIFVSVAHMRMRVGVGVLPPMAHGRAGVFACVLAGWVVGPWAHECACRPGCKLVAACWLACFIISVCLRTTAAVPSSAAAERLPARVVGGGHSFSSAAGHANWPAGAANPPEAVRAAELIHSLSWSCVCKEAGDWVLFWAVDVSAPSDRCMPGHGTSASSAGLCTLSVIDTVRNWETKEAVVLGKGGRGGDS